MQKREDGFYIYSTSLRIRVGFIQSDAISTYVFSSFTSQHYTGYNDR